MHVHLTPVDGPHPRKYSLRRIIEWPAIWILAGISVLIGTIGFAQYAEHHHHPGGWPEHLYRSLQLFVLHMPHLEGELNWKIEFARFAAPFVSFYTATKALLLLFREQFRLMKLFRTSGHVVICGLSRKGSVLALDFDAAGDTVVVIERDAANHHIERLRSEGVTVLVGDATNEKVLAFARVPRAKQIITVCDNDGTNVEVALRVRKLFEASESRRSASLSCHVHIVDPNLRERFREQELLANTQTGYDVEMFDLYRNSARLLLSGSELDREHIGNDATKRVHLVVVGFGQMGESVVLQAARTAHYANGQKAKITIIDEAAKAKEPRFRHQYENIKSVCEVEFIESDADEAQLLERIYQWTTNDSFLITVVVCFDDDTKCLSFALRLLPGLEPAGVPIRVRMADKAGLATLLDEDEAAPRVAQALTPFGMLSEICTREMVLNEKLDRLAMAIHELYNRKRKEENPGFTPKPWTELPDDLKESNRQQADHIAIKLRAVNAGAASREDQCKHRFDGFTNDEIETLAKMEHARWNAERYLYGWTFGEKDTPRKKSPYLVNWSELTDEIQDYDRAPIRNMPDLLDLVDKKICRNAPPPGRPKAP